MIVYLFFHCDCTWLMQRQGSDNALVLHTAEWFLDDTPMVISDSPGTMDSYDIIGIWVVRHKDNKTPIDDTGGI